MMRKIAITLLAVAIVFGMSMGAMAGNEATIEQDGTDLDARIEQVGTENIAEIIESGLGYSTHDDWLANSLVEQEGTAKEASIDVDGDSGNNTVYTRIDQSGEENFADIERHFSAGNGVSTTAEIIQDGYDNSATVYDTTHAGTVFIDQEGDQNEADVTSYGPGTNHSYLVQEGNYNTINLEQDPDGWNTNDATLEQFGDNNTIDVDQGGGDTALVTQDGDDNEAEVIQN